MEGERQQPKVERERERETRLFRSSDTKHEADNLCENYCIRANF